MVNQYIVEDGAMRSLKAFADDAVTYLKQHPDCDEVVQVADHIEELKDDKRTPPKNMYALPDGYEYNFSGFFGQVVGVGREGIRELHKRMES